MTRNDNSDHIIQEVCILDRQIREPSHYEGRLPASAPLANPYVPFQLENPPQYEAKKGLVRGTMFPGLDLPFMGMVNQQELPPSTLAELQSLGFAIQELALYLDTHREDRDALALYRGYQEMYDKCRQLYVQKHGPLNHGMPTASGGYDWLDDPWPWEYCANKEE